MRNVRYLLSRVWHLSFGGLLIVAAGWAGIHAIGRWNQVQTRFTARHPVVERPKFVVMDSDIANDPAMQATKVDPVGPMAKVLKWDESRGSAESDEGSEFTQSQATKVPEATDPVPLKRRRAVGMYTPAPLRLCRGNMILSRSRTFHFQIPANMSFPRLKGQFTSRIGREPHPLNVLLLNQQQYSELMEGGPEITALHDSESSNEQVDLVLSPTLDAERDYYLVLRNLSRQPLTVEASFTVTFD